MVRIVPPGRYAAERLRTPAELAEVMDGHGLHSEDVRGFKPRSAPSPLKAVLARRRGEITDDEVASRVSFVLEAGKHPLLTYLGYARRR